MKDKTNEIIAIASKNGEIYEYRGENTELPVKFEGLTTNYGMTIDNGPHLITLQLNGLELYVKPIGSEEGKVLLNMSDDIRGLRDTEEIKEVIDDYLDEIE